MLTLGGGVRPSASKNCCTAPMPDDDGPCTGYVQPLSLYHAATVPSSKRAAASLWFAFALTATSRGVLAPPNTPGGNGLTGTSARTLIVAVPPLVSTTSVPSSGL